jgi:hypothetical protein
MQDKPSNTERPLPDKDIAEMDFLKDLIKPELFGNMTTEAAGKLMNAAQPALTTLLEKFPELKKQLDGLAGQIQEKHPELITMLGRFSGSVQGAMGRVRVC